MAVRRKEHNAMVMRVRHHNPPVLQPPDTLWLANTRIGHVPASAEITVTVVHKHSTRIVQHVNCVLLIRIQAARGRQETFRGR
ncbi:MAG: hypothetical protein ACKOEO_07615, partial [Planctomycetaceae bacterium]